MLRLGKHRPLLEVPALARPLSGHTYAVTGPQLLTVHAGPACRLAATGPLFPSADLAAHPAVPAVGTVAGCPLCDTSGLVALLGQVLDAVHRLCEDMDAAAGAAADTTNDAVTLRAEADPGWQFVGRSLLEDLAWDLDKRLPDGGWVGALPHHEYRALVSDWFAGRGRALTDEHPALRPTDGPRDRVVVVNATMATDGDAALFRLRPVAAHRDSGGGLAVFEVDAAHQDWLVDRSRSTLPRGPRAVPVPRDVHQQLQRDGQWQVVLHALATDPFGPQEELSRMLVAAAAACRA